VLLGGDHSAGQELRVKHDLKCWPHYLAEIRAGRKTFDVRSTKDRCFQAGDELYLYTYDPTTRVMSYSESITVDVLAVYADLPGLEAGHVAMSIRRQETA
jgi:uncharacterized protein YqfB (UPF0267 family)